MPLDTTDSRTERIILQCRDLDRCACELYSAYGERFAGKDLGGFWTTMAAQEKGHVVFWDRVAQSAAAGEIPDIFKDSGRVIKELETVADRSRSLLCGNEDSGIQQVFLSAYKMEFYLLHPAFERLFWFMRSTAGVVEPFDAYENHLNLFLDTMTAELSRTSVELELLSQTVRDLWHSSRSLAVMSIYDELTGLLNRRGFFDASRSLASLAYRKGLSMGIIMADIDKFKNVNDTHGHQTGDRVLAGVASVLRDNIRASDIVGRYGGEEFVVLLTDVDEKTAVEVAEKLRAMVQIQHPGSIPTTMSLGVATGDVSTDQQKSLMELITIADNRLYASKESGRNRVTWAG